MLKEKDEQVVAEPETTLPVHIGEKPISFERFASLSQPGPNLFQRILRVMEDVSYVQKEEKKVNNQYTFVSHDAVIAKLRPALIKHGIVVVPTVLEFKQDGNTTVVSYRVSFINAENPADFIQVDTLGYGVDPQDKGPGKAMSYAYKYAMLKMFCLETGDDPERDNIPRATGGGATEAPGKPKPTTPDLGVENYLLLLSKAADKGGLDEEMKTSVMNKYKGMASNMTFAAWKHAVEGAIEKIEKQATKPT